MQAYLKYNNKLHVDRFNRLCTAHGRQSHWFTVGRPFPPHDCRFAWDSDAHLTHGFLGKPESTSQTTSRCFQPFLQGSRWRQTDLLRDRPRDRRSIGRSVSRSVGFVGGPNIHTTNPRWRTAAIFNKSSAVAETRPWPQ